MRILEEQPCQISSRSDLKRLSQLAFFEEVAQQQEEQQEQQDE